MRRQEMKSSVKDLVNLPRLEQAMDRAGVDAVVARAGLNFTYLAGFAYPGTLARHVDLADSPRSVWVLWPRKGEPRIVLNGIARDLAARDSWIEKYVCLRSYRAADRACCQVAAGDGARPVEDRDRAELRFRRRHGDTQGQVARAQDIRPRADHGRARAVKTAGEIARLKIGADVLDDAFTRCFPITKPGTRERDLHGALIG